MRYAALDAGRLRALGGGTNHWGGWCRPMDAIDFEARPWMPHSGWPFPRTALDPYYPKAQSLVEAGPWIYDQKGDAMTASEGSVLPLGQGGLYTSWFQFSKMRGNVLPTQFGHRYEAELKGCANLTPLLHANVTAIRLSHDARKVDRPVAHHRRIDRGGRHAVDQYVVRSRSTSQPFYEGVNTAF